MNWNYSYTGLNAFQAIFVPLCCLLAARALLRLWNGRLSRLSGGLGVFIWSAAAIAIAVPDLTRLVANKVGINRGADLVFYLAILGGVSVCFYFYQRFRHLENLVTEVVRCEAVRNAQCGSKSTDGDELLC
jgi:small membrane protein